MGGGYKTYLCTFKENFLIHVSVYVICYISGLYKLYQHYKDNYGGLPILSATVLFKSMNSIVGQHRLFTVSFKVLSENINNGIL